MNQQRQQYQPEYGPNESGIGDFMQRQMQQQPPSGFGGLLGGAMGAALNRPHQGPGPGQFGYGGAPAMTQEQLRSNIQQTGRSPSQGYGGLGAAGQQQINQLLQDAQQRSQQGPDAGMQAAFAGFQRDQANAARNGPIDPARLAQIQANAANQGPAGQMNQQQLRGITGGRPAPAMTQEQLRSNMQQQRPNPYQMYGGLGSLFNMQNAYSQRPAPITQAQSDEANRKLLEKYKTTAQQPAQQPAQQATQQSYQEPYYGNMYG